MSAKSRLLAVAALAVAALAVPPAQADVGVEAVSRAAGAPGDRVDLTIGCGFCYPPCHGEPGHRRPSPCMLGTEAQPPRSFPVSLVPIEQAPKPHPCGPNALCPPATLFPPGRAPYALLGRAVEKQHGETPSGHLPPPRYLLHFSIPDVRPGLYTYVVFCAVCMQGKRGSLVADPGNQGWRLRVRRSPS